MGTHPAICPLCEATCGLSVTVANARIEAIRGNPDDVFSRGFICPKGFALKALDEDPDRLRRPWLRTGERWDEVSWDDAFAYIEDRLPALQQAHGRDAVATYLGNPNVHNLSGQLYLPPLLKALGSRNIYSASTLDQMPKHVACSLLFGHGMSVPVPDLDRTDYLLVLGANPLVSNGSMLTAPNMPARLKAICERGKVVVLDPRRTRTAQLASEHHFLRPGSDAYLLFALVDTLFQEGLTAAGRLGAFLTGTDTVKDLAARFPAERVEARCGVPAATIRRLARELAAAPRAAVYGRLGTCTQEFGTLASWLVDVLNVLTGNLDREGGAMFARAAAGERRRGARPSTVTSRVRGLAQVQGELPTATLAEEILTPGPGQVRALLTVAGNPVLSAPDSARLERALTGLDLMISVDCYRNETTRLAHVILPPPPPLRRAHYDLTFTQLSVRNQARYAPALLPWEGPDEWEILLRLTGLVVGVKDLQALDDAVAAKLHDPAPPGRGPERLLDLLLRAGPYPLTLQDLVDSPDGVDLGPLEPRLPELLCTPSRTIELAPEPLVADVERLEAGLAVPIPDLVLIGRRELRSNNSWMHNLPVLVKGPHPCTLLVHPRDGERLGLGQTATVSTSAGSLEAAVELTDSIMPGVVSLPHGWGHDRPGAELDVAAQRPGVNLNLLIPATAVEPLSGTAIQNAVAVTVR